MATNSKKETQEIQRVQQGVEAEACQTKLIFTPEQSRILGEAYRVILNWRLEPVISETSPAVAAKVEA